MTLLATFAVVLCVAGCTLAQLYVGPGGTDPGNNCALINLPCASLSNALTHVTSGASIFFLPGTYSSPGNCFNTISIANIVISALSVTSSNQPEITQAPGTTCGWTVTANQVSIRGLNFTDFASPAIQAAGSLNIGLSVSSCTFQRYNGLLSAMYFYNLANQPTVPAFTIQNSVFLNNIGTGPICGGAICVVNAVNANVVGFPQVVGCTFRGNSAVGQGLGGAVTAYTVNSYLYIVITNCVFENNFCATKGGAAAAFGSGANLMVYGSTFVANSATTGGSALLAGGLNGNNAAIISNCVFRLNVSPGNTAADCGGLCTVTNSQFYNNSGGGLSLDSVIVMTATGLTFVGNTNGPALFVSPGGYEQLTISNNIFIENSGTNGAAILLAGGGPISNSVFIGNSASEYGGAIYCSSPAIISGLISGCTFTNNAAGIMGGAVYTYGDIQQCTFTGNTAPNGAAIVVPVNAQVSLTAITMVGNVASQDGGGLYVQGIVQQFQGTAVGNSALNGGAVATYGQLWAFGASTVFQNNMASARGGALYISSTPTPLATSFNGVAFSGNAASYGGAIACLATTCPVSNCAFTNNGASVIGGGVYTVGNTLTLSGNVFYDNSAAVSGGAVATEACTIPFAQANQFSNNTALQGGSAVFMSQSSGQWTSSNTFSGDISSSQVFVFNSSHVLLSQMSFNGSQMSVAVTASQYISICQSYGSGVMINDSNVIMICGSAFASATSDSMSRNVVNGGCACTSCALLPSTASGALIAFSGGNPVCVSCPTGSYQAGAPALTCSSCAAGAFSSVIGANSSSTCSQCLPGTTALRGSGICSPCALGSYTGNHGATNCTVCPTGSYGNYTGGTSIASCFACDVGTYSRVTGASACTPCPAGQFSGVSSASACNLCEAGTYSPTLGATSPLTCLPCPAGSAQLAFGQSSCSECTAGTYSPSTGAKSCTGCVAGTYSVVIGAQNASVCIPCSPGTYSAQPAGPSEDVCTPCVPGFATAGAGLTAQTPCQLGTFQNQSGASFCYQCNPGTATTFIAATSQQNCDPCPLGTSGLGGGCSSCPAGTYADVTGLTVCTPCPAGTFSTALKSTSSAACSSCPAGQHSLPGSTQCSQCPAGYYSGSQGTCVPCAQGTYSPTEGALSQDSCLSCNPGTYGAAPGQPCVACPAGTYSDEVGAAGVGNCIGCPAGSYATRSGATSILACISCPSGTYSNLTALTNASKCITCPAGTFSAVAMATSDSACVPCGVGTYSESPGATKCTQCPVGSIGLRNGSVSSGNCQTCPLGAYSPFSESAACYSCAPGTYGNVTGLSACFACPSGFYSTGNSSMCQPCGAGILCPIATGTGVAEASLSFFVQSSSYDLVPSNMTDFLQTGAFSISLNNGTVVEKLSDEVQKQRQFVTFVVAGTGVAALLCLLFIVVGILCCSSRSHFLLNALMRADVLYSLKHSVSIGQPLVKRRTAAGGFAATVFAAASLLLVLYLSLSYARYSFEALETLNTGSIDVNPTSLNGSIYFIGYGDQCSSASYASVIEIEGLSGQTGSSVVPLQSLSACVVRWWCTSCSMTNTEARVTATLNEPSSRAMFIVAVTQASPVVPFERNEVWMMQAPQDPNSVFQGAVATTFQMLTYATQLIDLGTPSSGLRIYDGVSEPGSQVSNTTQLAIPATRSAQVSATVIFDLFPAYSAVIIQNSSTLVQLATEIASLVGAVVTVLGISLGIYEMLVDRLASRFRNRQRGANTTKELGIPLMELSSSNSEADEDARESAYDEVVNDLRRAKQEIALLRRSLNVSVTSRGDVQ
eukprot:TRINITY_DN7475_c0_g1_i1.p1 TRINITY_DN7475_c0_g1~~TRINITY_DN7475_c0_g1_i1.p1  ORF type:complete len:1793 (+),score=192.77 TRINITY_DN7475_c0_g1_i1:63-5441(+)